MPDARKRIERFLLASVDPTEPFGEHRALWNEVWSSLRVDEELRPIVQDAYASWVGELARLVGQARSDSASPIDARSAAWRLAAVVDGLDSMLYLGLVDRARARRLVRQSIEKELGS